MPALLDFSQLTLVDLAQVTTGVGAIVAILMNLRDRRERSRPYLAINTVGYTSFGDEPINQDFIFNAGSGPAVNVGFRVQTIALNFETPADVPGVNPRWVSHPSLHENPIGSEWLAKATEPFIELLPEEAFQRAGRKVLHLRHEITAAYRDSANLRYIQRFWVETMADTFRDGSRRSFVELRLVASIERGGQGRERRWLPWTEGSKVWKELRSAEEDYRKELEERYESRFS